MTTLVNAIARVEKLTGVPLTQSDANLLAIWFKFGAVVIKRDIIFTIPKVKIKSK